MAVARTAPADVDTERITTPPGNIKAIDIDIAGVKLPDDSAAAAEELGAPLRIRDIGNRGRGGAAGTSDEVAVVGAGGNVDGGTRRGQAGSLGDGGAGSRGTAAVTVATGGGHVQGRPAKPDCGK